MKFEMAIAGPEDDPAIRRLVSSNPMPGKVAVAFEREPDFFLGQGIMGDQCLTLKAVERESGRLAGIMSMASAERRVNGRVQRVGYVGGVRIDREFQGTMLPLRVMPFIRDLVREDWPHLWFGAVVHGNPAARALFVDLPRTSFPPPEPVSEFHTLAILTRGRLSAGGPTPDGELDDPRQSGRIRIFRGTQIGWDAIVSFLNDSGHYREFFPHVNSGRFAGARHPPFPELGDFLVADVAGRIAGVCAVWDQSGFKQTVVHGYSGWLAGMKPLINAASSLTGMKKLPDIGGTISSASLSFLAVRNDDPGVFRSLLKTARADARARGKDYLMTGFSVRDPLLPVARKYRHILYRSTMYAFSFDGPIAGKAFDRRKVPYMEGSTL